MATTGLPKGFVYGDEVKSSKPRQWEQEPPDAFVKPKKVEHRRINTLSEALQVFRVRMDVTKLKDVKLGGLRVGAMFRQLSTGKMYLLLFKREPYFHFAKHFPKVPERGYGMICNLKLAHWAALEDIIIVTVMPDGRAYSIDGKTLYDYYEKYDTEVPHMEGEMATPFKMWRRLF